MLQHIVAVVYASLMKEVSHRIPAGEHELGWISLLHSRF